MNPGGQNMIEPAAFAAAVLFGPNTQNFRQVVELLLSEQAARVVRTPEELTSTIRELLEDPARSRQLGETAQRLVLQQPPRASVWPISASVKTRPLGSMTRACVATQRAANGISDVITISDAATCSTIQ